MSRPSNTPQKEAALVECAASDCSVKFRPARRTQKFHDPKCSIRERNRRSNPGGSPGPKARVMADIGSDVTREEILEHEVKTLTKQVKAARALEVFDAKALALLERSIEAVEPSFEPYTFAVDRDMTEHKFVLQWSDLHAAERVSYEQMNGLNEFNWEIMNERHARMQRAVLSFKKNRPYPVNDLIILGLGDMVTGDIHDELRETNEVVCTESAVKLGFDGADFIASFAPYFKNIYVSGVVGNHGRVTNKPEFKNPHKNWDWIMYVIMELRLREFDNITVEIPKSFEHVVQVFDKNILTYHGDGVPSNMPGVPWGGITRNAKEKFDSWMSQGIFINHFACGHYHEANVVGQKKILMNGSIKGQDEYAKKRYGGGRPACQLLHTFHPTRGLTESCYLDLA